MSDFARMEQRFDPNNPAGSMVQFGDDARLFVEFVSRPVLDEAKSREAGRPVHKQVDFVRIRQPGERDEILRPAHDGDRRRFTRPWQAYQEGRQAMPEGTPLAILFPNNPEVVENLKHDKIFVVEQLAELNDTQIGNIGLGGRQFVDRAKAFLKAANSSRGFAQLTAKVDQMESERAADREKIKALEEALAEATRKRGEAA